MQVKVMGSGCSNCEKLVELLKKAGDELLGTAAYLLVLAGGA